MTIQSMNQTTPAVGGLGLVDRQDVAVLVAAAAGVIPGPSTERVQFGSSTGSFPEEGNLDRQLFASGANVSVTTANSVMAVTTIPGAVAAAAFDQAGRGITITAAGSFAANNDSKTISIVFNPSTAVVGQAVGAGGTTIATTGAQTTNANGGGWFIGGNVFKVGAAGSNTQIGTSNGSIVNATHGGTTAPTFPTATETGPILVALVVSAPTSAADVQLNFWEVNAMN